LSDDSSMRGLWLTRMRAGNEILQRLLADALPRQLAGHLDAVDLGRRRRQGHAALLEADLADLGGGEAHGITIGVAPPAAAISPANVARRSARRATRAKRWPFDAKTRASSVPIPAEAPVISVTRSVTIGCS